MFYYLNAFFYWLFKSNATSQKTSSAVFEIYKDLLGEYRFRLKAENGEIVLVSEGYRTKASAKKGIASVKRHSMMDVCYDRKQAVNGQSMFTLKAANHEVIGNSELYASTYNRDRGIQSVKRSAPNASIVYLC